MSQVLETPNITTQFEAVITNLTIGELQTIQVAYKFNRKNYLKWSQLVHTFLKDKWKLSHLLGTRPRRKDPWFDAWDEQDLTIMARLWNLMTLEINDTCMFLTTAKDIQDAVH